MRYLFVFVALVAALASEWIQAEENSLIQHYGQIPMVRDVTVSPDGEHYAFIQRRADGNEVFLVINAATNELVGGADASKLKARNVYFATNDHVILTVSQTAKSFYVRNDWENDSAVAYNFKERKMRGLLLEEESLYPAQTGLSRVVGVNIAKNEVYIPAYVGPLSSRNPPNHLMRVNLDTGKGLVHARGKGSTIDWFVDDEGNVLAREDFDNRKNKHRVYSYSGSKPKLIYEYDSERPSISLLAVDQSGEQLIFVDDDDEGEGVYTLSMKDGTVTGPRFQQSDRDIDRVITYGLNRQFMGARISGATPTYRYLDEPLGKTIDQVLEKFNQSSVYPISATADLKKIIFSITGNDTALAYLLLDTESEQMSWIGKAYPEVQYEHIGVINSIEYMARDGQKIPAILTLPTGVKDPKNLPMLVFPHGGPEAYDQISFDWWAQYFARKGYLVFQPNFRGSTGYGIPFRDAGRGQWGRLMQNDITDGVTTLTNQGYADPDRVCIMGASYGGYAALAGGAYTPDLYRCVISVAGVSDVLRMIRAERRQYGSNHWVVSYWEELIGDSKEEREKLREISPYFNAEQFKAPVLLLHGKDDVVVPIDQSKRMERALKKAGAPVEMITMKGEDHWLSRSETRLAMLQEIDTFLSKHNPVN